MMVSEATEQEKVDLFHNRVSHGFAMHDINRYQSGEIDTMVSFCGLTKSKTPLRPKDPKMPCCEVCLDVIVARASQNLHRL